MAIPRETLNKSPVKSAVKTDTHEIIAPATLDLKSA